MAACDTQLCTNPTILLRKCVPVCRMHDTYQVVRYCAVMCECILSSLISDPIEVSTA